MTLRRWLYGEKLDGELTDKEAIDSTLLRGGKRVRHNRELDAIRALARIAVRRRLSLAAAGLFGVGIATYGVLHRDDPVSSSDSYKASSTSRDHFPLSHPSLPPPPPFPSIPSTLERPRDHCTVIENPSDLTPGADIAALFDFQEQWHRTTEQALDRFKDHPEARLLADHFGQHGLMSIPHGPQVIQVIYKGDSSGPETALANPLSFAVTYMPAVFAAGMRSAVLTQYGDPPLTIRIAGTIPCQEWLAIFLLHELKHVYDLQVKGENPFAEEEYLAGEVGAHQFENELLREWNPEAYDFFIQEAKRLFFDSRGNVDGVMGLIHELYPLDGLTQGTQGAAQASLFTAMLFEAAEERHFSQEEMQRLYAIMSVDFGTGAPVFQGTHSLLMAPRGF